MVPHCETTAARPERQGPAGPCTCSHTKCESVSCRKCAYRVSQGCPCFDIRSVPRGQVVSRRPPLRGAPKAVLTPPVREARLPLSKQGQEQSEPPSLCQPNVMRNRSANCAASSMEPPGRAHRAAANYSRSGIQLRVRGCCSGRHQARMASMTNPMASRAPHYTAARSQPCQRTDATQLLERDSGGTGLRRPGAQPEIPLCRATRRA